MTYAITVQRDKTEEDTAYSSNGMISVFTYVTPVLNVPALVEFLGKNSSEKGADGTLH
jgi:hypothetical protein